MYDGKSELFSVELLVEEVIKHQHLFAVTGWLLCVITNIFKASSDHSYSDHCKQVNRVIKTLFFGLSRNELNFTLDLFWTGYIDFDNNNGLFGGDGFIWKIKAIIGHNSHLFHQKYSLACTKVLGFLACIVTSKVIDIGAAYHYWGYVNTIKSSKRYAISSDVSEKHSTVYMSDFI